MAGLLSPSMPAPRNRRGLLAPMMANDNAQPLPGDDLSYVYNSEHSGSQAPTTRDNAKDLRSFSGLGEYFNDPGVRSDFKALGGMLSVASPTLTAMNAFTGNLPGGAAAEGLGNGGVNANDLGASLAEGNTNGTFAQGGRVQAKGLLGPNPPGPDEGYAALKGGELVVNAEQQKKLKPETLADLKAVLKKTGAKGMKK